MTDDRVSRRAFLVAGGVGSASLVLGFSLASLERDPSKAPAPLGQPDAFEPNLWIRINAAGDVELRIHKCEMGQGVLTALPMLIAEELEVEWSRIRVVQADADFRFTDQNTSGSSSISDSWTQLRQAGAATRIMLVRAAARRWRVAEADCEAQAGVVSHPGSGRQATYGELAGFAAGVVPPPLDSVPLKSADGFRLIGRPVRRLDADAKVTGRQIYGMDLRFPKMLYAAVTRCPVLGGTLRRLDDTRARTLPGVRQVIRLEADRPSRLPERVAGYRRFDLGCVRGSAGARDRVGRGAERFAFFGVDSAAIDRARRRDADRRTKRR